MERILAEADERLKYQLRGNRIRENLVEFIDQVCEKKGINPKELRMGSRRGCISQVRLVNYLPNIHIVMTDWYERTIKA